MGACHSYLCPCCQEETETTLCELKFQHPDMLEIFEKYAQALKTTLEQLDTKP